jgi:O-antigen biosynthesis protein WbqV
MGWKFIALRGAVTFIDVSVAGLAILASYAMIYNFSTLYYLSGLTEKIISFMLVSVVMNILFGVHRGSWRYVSLPDMFTIFKAVMSSVIVYTVAAFLISRGENVPRSVPILTAILLMAGWAAPRVAYRLAVEGHFLRGLLHRAPRPEKGRRNVLVLGFTNKAESFIRTWLRSGTSEFNVLGVIESSLIANSGSVHGIKVIGTFEDLPAIAERLKLQGLPVTELVVAEVSPSRKRLSEIVQITNSIGMRASRISDLTSPQSIADGQAVVTRPIELRDLLGRQEVTTDVSRVAELIENKVVLTTGAGGSIGSELVFQIASFRPKQLILADSSEHNTYKLDSEVRQRFPDLDIVTRLVDVREASRLDRLFEAYRPEVVFHAAALKHVPLIEDNPIEGIKTNILGTRNAVNAAMAHGASAFIMISTDKAVNPTNVMGATKRAAEAYCQAMDLASENTRFKTVRFGNVLGSSGSVVPRFQEQIRAGGPVTVTHPNIVRFFMTIPEAVRLVLHASSHALGRKSERGKIMVLDMGEPVRIVDLAERMIQLAGYKPGTDIEIVFSGLRPGEKLYEELFDPSEVQNSEAKEGYVIASPRVINQALLLSTIKRLEEAVAAEDVVRALELVRHIVPEYKAAPQGGSQTLIDDVAAEVDDDPTLRTDLPKS